MEQMPLDGASFGYPLNQAEKSASLELVLLIGSLDFRGGGFHQTSTRIQGLESPSHQSNPLLSGFLPENNEPHAGKLLLQLLPGIELFAVIGQRLPLIQLQKGLVGLGPRQARHLLVDEGPGGQRPGSQTRRKHQITTWLPWADPPRKATHFSWAKRETATKH